MAEQKSNKNVIVIAAHPDDEVLGCGGSLLRHVAKGDKVHVMFLTNGVSARGSDYGANLRSLACEKVMKQIGVTSFCQFDYPDNQLDTVPLLEIVKLVEDFISQVDPSIIYTHFSGDLNVDHRMCSAAVSTACRPLPETNYTEIYTFETPSSTEWSARDIFDPTHFINIQDYLDDKLNLMSIYEDEVRSFPHPRSLDAISALAKWRGSTSGFYAAEAFVPMKTRWR